MPLVSVKMPDKIVEELERLVEAGYFINISDAVREASRQLIFRYKEIEKRGPVPGYR